VSRTALSTSARSLLTSALMSKLHVLQDSRTVSPLITGRARRRPARRASHARRGCRRQVVHVAEDFLVRADEKDREVVRVAVQRVQRQRALDVAAVDELVDLPVRVAGDVAEHGVVGRGLSRRWIGITGKSCLMAQLSGIDWNSEKLQKYVPPASRRGSGDLSGTSSSC